MSIILKNAPCEKDSLSDWLVSFLNFLEIFSPKHIRGCPKHKNFLRMKVKHISVAVGRQIYKKNKITCQFTLSLYDWWPERWVFPKSVSLVDATCDLVPAAYSDSGSGEWKWAPRCTIPAGFALFLPLPGYGVPKRTGPPQKAERNATY